MSEHSCKIDNEKRVASLYLDTLYIDERVFMCTLT